MIKNTLLVIIAFAASCAYAIPQTKSVKGGHGGGGYFPYNASANLVRFYENGTQINYGQNTKYPIYETGVCYTEVPTASLIKTPGQIPIGNGSRPDLSRIRICCEGYVRNIHNFRLCDPICTQECVNSLCTAPETCGTCFPGHVKNLGGICVPTCPIGCQNGQCSGGECMCNSGFKLDYDSKFCSPVCKDNCGNQGNCTAPNTCLCNKGFEAIEGSCRAHCDRCTNGDCIGPNTCRCHPGYSSSRPGECIPQCPQGCGAGGHCSAPNVCSCAQGYEYDVSSRQCKPACTKPCLNGDCIAPNECRCHAGYTKEASNKEVCVPSCDQDCGPNGRCTGPNTCSCSPGFEMDQVSRTCRPLCSRPCYNGDCVGPNICQCHTGFSKNEYGECIPACPQDCGPNGRCTGPNTCSCSPGFEMDQVSRTCRPLCSRPCYNGDCVGPNICQCHTGFSKNEYGECIPACPQGCGDQGQCVAPNTCSCAPGSELDQISHQCRSNSRVSVDSCPRGYTIDREDPSGTKCIPHCPGGCPNGTCSSPNFCICNMGYVKDRSVKGRPMCVKRYRRSIQADAEPNVAKFLIFDIPDDY